VSYPSTMSRWDPEPTSFQRWMVLRRKEVRVGAVLLMLLGICWMVYGLVTRGIVGANNGSIPAVSFAGIILLASVNASRFVEEYDTEQRSPNSE
jgi:hypothetical protein